MRESSKVLAGAVALSVFLFLPAGTRAGFLSEPVDAPEWAVSEWLNGDPGSLADQQGKVVHYPITMRRFRTGGTPHVAIVDQQGRLRFSHFGAFDPTVVERFIDRLLGEPELTAP